MSEAMHNMKMEIKDNEISTDRLLGHSGHEFPHGLRVNLDPRVVEKLGIDRMPVVGQIMKLHAVVEVVEVSIDRSSNGGRDKSMSLQITDMALKDRSEDSLAEVAKEKEEAEKTILG